MSNLNLIISKNNTICGCEGTISVFGTGGFPPYTYSIDGGITFKQLPIFTNLCTGNYSVIILDISGQTRSSLVTIDPPTLPTTYVLSFNTSFTNTVNTPSQTTKLYTTNFTISPELPQGVTAIFDITHLNVFETSPNSGSSSNNTVTLLNKNSSGITLDYSSTTNSETFNPTPGCQGDTLFITSLTEEWKNISYSNGDDIKLITSSTVIKNDFIDCYLGGTNETYFINNLRITGCGCCNIISIQ